MRQRERIPMFLDKLDLELIHRIFIHWFNTNFEEIEIRVIKEKRKIKKFWIANHDLRFSQVLVNMGYLDNIPGIWYYEEDEALLLKLGLEPRDVLFWGQNFSESMNRLPETKWILIRDMTTDHIKRVIAFMGERLPERYKNVFQKELDIRNIKQ